MLRPKANAFRGLETLNGLWSFQLDSVAEAENPQPWTRTLPSTLQMPVPSSYNDVLTDEKIGNHIGWVYYQRRVAIPLGWQSQPCQIFLRFEAVTHHARVYVDDEMVAEHIGGYTPFDVNITSLVPNEAGREFRLTVAVGNELTWHTIPPGRIEVDARGRKKQFYQHDFFNHSGIARSVWLHCVPTAHIWDINVTSNVHHAHARATVDYEVTVEGPADGEATDISVRLFDEEDRCVAEAHGRAGSLQVDPGDLHLWRPGAAYLYRLSASLSSAASSSRSSGGAAETLDRYDLPVGIRSVEVRGNQFLINNEPIYLTGFGKHEDSPHSGKAHDAVAMVHDFSLLSWTGANSVRTAHYPHSEDVLEYADRHGLLVVDETPAVGINLAIIAGVTGKPAQPTFSPGTHDDRTRAAHADAIRELVARDKNHACVVMWCLANEPASADRGAREYFAPLVELARSLDPQGRPLCYTNEKQASCGADALAGMFDVLFLNRYYGWYLSTGDLGEAEAGLEAELREWTERYPGKPIVMSEYGADTLAGLHAPPGRGHGMPWSEEYQVAMLEMSHRVYDRFEAVVGEHVWSFADFQTPTSFIFRVDGNKKGVFTRDRRPKAAAESLRKRWTAIKGKKPSGL